MDDNRVMQHARVELAGGDRSVISVSSAKVLAFVGIRQAATLRAVSRELRSNIADHIWNDDNAIIPGEHTMGWLASFPQIRAVNLSRQTIPNNAFGHLRSFVKLNLSLSQFPELSIAGDYPQLEWLDLSEENVIGHPNERRITSTTMSSLHCPRLTFLNLDSCEGIDSLESLHFPLLTTLDLSWCTRITDAGLEALQCPLLSTLFLTNSGITDAGLNSLQCPMLTSLNMSGSSGITDAGLAAIRYPKLTHLDLSWCTSISCLGGLQCPLLTSLDLRSLTKLTDAGLAALNCPLLTTLDLSWCTDITRLGELQCPRITTLDLSSCSELTNTGLAALDCPLLFSLSLKDCAMISNAGLGALRFPELTHLNLEGTGTEVPKKIGSAQEIMIYARVNP